MTTWEGAIRLATDADGPRIGQLYKACAWPDHGVDWTQPGVGGWWLLAEHDGHLLGALQIIASKPFGYVGDIVVHPSVRGACQNGNSGLAQDFGPIAKALYASAMLALTHAGSQMMMGIVARPGLLRTFRRYGVQDYGEWTLVGRRLG